jgi:hypothetical protein
MMLSPKERMFRLVARASLLYFSGALSAQSGMPEVEYKKRIRVTGDIQPLGENPFGESIQPLRRQAVLRAARHQSGRQWTNAPVESPVRPAGAGRHHQCAGERVRPLGYQPSAHYYDHSKPDSRGD